MDSRKFTLSLAFALVLALVIACQSLYEDDAQAISIDESLTPSPTEMIYIPTVQKSKNDYYVSTLGDDKSDGRTEVTALRTLGRALEVVQPGEIIQVLEGTYKEALMLENIGSSESPITIRGVYSTTVFDGQRTMTIGFWCEMCNNLIIEDLTFQNYTDIGIGVYLSTQITMDTLIVHHNGFAAQLTDWDIEGYGIQTDESQNITIINSEVYNNGPDPRPFGRLGTGIDSYACTDCVIRNNYSHDNIGGGILVEDGVNVLVVGNEVRANYLDATEDEWWDGGIWIDGGHDIILRDNHFYENIGPGIQISNEDHQNVFGYLLENNLSTQNIYGIYIWNFGASDFPPDNILRLSNNQFYDNKIQDVWIVPWECPPPEPCEE